MVLQFFHGIYGNKFTYKSGTYVRKSFTVVIEDNGGIEIGRDVFFNNFCSLNSLCHITIGDNCIFGENVHIYDHNHLYKDKNIPVNNQGFSLGTVSIGSNSWIGSNVVILKGVSIGEHCVIGANCVVYKDIPSNSMLLSNNTLKKI